jgi:mannose-6-phosphate isomerase-like protein (cupin superfamily)
MTGFVGDIEKLTEKNQYFRQVLYTGKYAQLVVMNLQPGEEIGNEVHNTVDQFFRIEEGEAKFGTFHNVINTSNKEPLKLYTVYSPPNHPDGTVHKIKAEAEAAEAAHHH